MEKLDDVVARLKDAAAGKIEVSGRAVDPLVAYENLRGALSYVEKYFPVKRGDIYFQQFPGNVVGESTAEGVQIDPIMLMHPSMRLAHVLAHELAHSNNEIQNEGLVEAYVKALGLVDDGGELTEKYDRSLVDFYQFVRKVAGGRDENLVIKEIYQLYYARKYEAIYELARASKAEDFFWEVFPELDFDQTGETCPFALESALIDSEHATSERADYRA